jgi:glycosyltransferase involved in cell wall biosynthesis
MKIAYIDSQFPTVATFLTWEMRYVKSIGHKIILFPLRTRHNLTLINDDAKNINEDVVYISLFSWQVITGWVFWIKNNPIKLTQLLLKVLGAYIKEPKYFLKTAYGLHKGVLIAFICKKEKIDLIHSNWAHVPGTVAYFISDLAEIPFSFSAHAGADIYRSQVLLQEKIQHAQFILTCTKKNRSFLLKYCRTIDDKNKVNVVYHGIDSTIFKQTGKKRTNLNNTVRLISVGGIDGTKGHIYMVRACKQLLDNNYHIHYSIVGGNGNMTKKIQKEILALGLTDDVTLTGILSRKKLVNKLNESDIFVMPSIEVKDGGQDGIPNVIIEAMAVKLPIVATDAGAISEVVMHGHTGIMADQKSPESLCKHMEKIFNQEYDVNSMIENAYVLVKKDFDRKKCVKDIGGIINQQPGDL